VTRRDLALISQTRAQLADGSARLRRETAGIKVGEMAEALGVSPQAVSMWEHARRVPDSVHALAYAKALAAASGANAH
jgi:transcriptional regulator with XRE-family HTH domain